MNVKTLILVSLVLALSSSQLVDLSFLTAEYIVNTHTAGSQFDPRLLELGNGNFLAAWTDNGRIEGYDLFGQIITPLGIKIGGEVLLNTNLTGDSGHITFTELTNTNIVICFTHSIDNAQDEDIFREILCTIRTADLTLYRDEWEATLGANKQGWEYQPYTRTLDDGTWMLCYTGFDDHQVGIFARRFSTEGFPMVDAQLNTDWDFRDQSWCNFEVVGADRIVFAWQSWISDGNFEGVVGRVFDYNLNPITSEIDINDVTVDRQRRPRLAAFPRAMNQIAIGYDNNGVDIRWKTYTLDLGMVVLPEMTVPDGIYRFSDYTIDVLASTNVIVCGERMDSDQVGVACQEYSSMGVALGSSFLVNIHMSGDQFEMDIATRTQGGLVAVWTSSENDASGFGVAGRTLDGSCSACGDPHIKTQWGCHIDAPITQERAVLMDCGQDSLSIAYNEAWDYHIHTVYTVINGRRDHYRWGALVHSQTKKICGNTIEFHRYALGINLRIKSLVNHNFSGMFNDSSCIDWSQGVPNFHDKSLLAD